MKFSFNEIRIWSSRTIFMCGLFLSSFCISSIGFAQTLPSVSSEVDTTFIKIGDQLNFKVTVEVDSTDNVIFPEGQTFSPLETVEAFATDTTRKKDRIMLMKTYALTQFDSGSYTLPTQRIEINGKGYFTDSLRIDVATVPVDTMAQKMYDIKPLIQVEKSNSGWWKILLGVLVILAIVAGLVYWFVFRKKNLSEAEKEALLPPYDRALLELKKLDNSKYLIQDEYKQYYSELTDIVRSYLEEDVNVSALESTTDELILKLEMMKDAGELNLDRDTINQFKSILQTADLVKFAKSKPATNVALQDRKAVEQIVVKTHEAIPEPTLEELMAQEEYQEELTQKLQRKKWVMAGSAALGAILISAIALISYYGVTQVWDTVTGHPTKNLLDSDWVASSYGYPPIHLESPEVLVRQKVNIPAEAKANIKELQSFMFRDDKSLLTLATTSTTFTQPAEPEFEKTIDQLLKGFEAKGAKNIVTKQEEFVTVTGVKGIKTYGNGKFKIPESEELVRGKYVILSFGGKGFQQQVLLTWQDGDPYAEEIINRVLSTIEVKTEV
ncbi:BatD family protein [Maribacter arenosus]|uniref:BatD family protein n=1 Tax=Maribacter arenosus TaxID=1854708 RepID=UPI001CB76794|nr:BatD family protein [Maribacter arenosus]